MLTPEGGSALIARTIEHFGKIDLLVNNAGICGSQLFEDATLEDFDHYWRVHLGGPVTEAYSKLSLKKYSPTAAL